MGAELVNVIEASAGTIANAVSHVSGTTANHHGATAEIEIIDASHARGIWPMVDRLKFPAGGAVIEKIGYSHYHETYVKERGKWRIRTLKLTRLRIDFVRA